ncbi:hypothetical protein [Vagococcus carniphilus]|uniref:Uncharacterized protein n=1 Tax=Vagococcus carniphilus TaxID=218144 RepID=A0A430AQI3_9ENTE|nr:hypothetical protein [Vagococcus carniphilus]QNN74572.1 hypothetical protein H9L18_14815 [Vagococcus carniphilus]RSU10382.1 hypothetical protein CBF28_13775 [Vagococcus carniphilus]
MKKWNEWTKKQKMTLGIVVACVVVGGAVGTNVYAKNQHQQAVTQALETIKKEKLTLEQLQKAVDELRDKENPNFLAKEVDLKALDSIQKQIDQLKAEHKNDSLSEVAKENKEVVTILDEVESNVKAVNYQLMTQNKVTQLFTVNDKEQVIAGTDFNLELPTADDLTLADIEAVVTATKNEAKLVTIPKSTDEKKSWELAIESLIKEAEKQVTEINDLIEVISKWFDKENKPVDTVKRDDLKAIEKRINNLKNQKVKEGLSVKWKQVNEAVVKKEKAEADKKAKETGGKVEQKADGTFEVTTPQDKPQNVASNDAGTTNQDTGYQGNQGGGYNPPATNNGGNNNSGGGSVTPPTNNGGGQNPGNNGGNNNGGNNNGGGGNVTPPAHTCPTAPYATAAEAEAAGFAAGAKEVVANAVICDFDGKLVGWTYTITAYWD